MFGQVNETRFDVRFELFGVPVRIHPVFWLSSAYLGWFDDRLDLTLVHVICILFAVLVHELGHALMNARYGFRSEIVLYILGGYATSMRHGTWRDIAVYVAGPAAGFLLLAAIYLPAKFSGLIVGWSLYPRFDPAVALQLPQWIRPGSDAWPLFASAISFSVFIGFVWNVVNLLPVLPLDGGQISRELFLHYRRRDGMKLCLQLSMLAGGAVAAYAVLQMSRDRGVFGLEPLFLAIMFGYLAFQSHQSLQQLGRGWR